MCRSMWAAAAPTAQARPNLCFHNMLFLITLALASVFAQVAGTCDITVFTKSWQCSCGGKAREVSRGCWWESGRRMWCEDQSFARRVQWTNTFPKILVGFCTILVVSLLLSAAREWLWSSSYCTIRPWCDFFLVPILIQLVCHHILPPVFDSSLSQQFPFHVLYHFVPFSSSASSIHTSLHKGFIPVSILNQRRVWKLYL